MLQRVVVGAALVDDLDRPRRVLSARRTAPPELAGGWEFPGGKVEAGEDLRAALVRELAEELGVEAVIGPEIVGTDPQGWPLPTGYRLRLFWAHADRAPAPHDGSHDALRWLSADTMADVAWLPADADAVRVVGRLLRDCSR